MKYCRRRRPPALQISDDQNKQFSFGVIEQPPVATPSVYPGGYRQFTSNESSSSTPDVDVSETHNYYQRELLSEEYKKDEEDVENEDDE